MTEGQQQHEVHICGERGRSPEVIAVRLCCALTCQSADTARASTCSRSLLRELSSQDRPAWWLADGACGMYLFPPDLSGMASRGPMVTSKKNQQKIKRRFGETPLCDPRVP